MAEHETIADIIAWLRRPREGENAYLTLWRDEIADRLEAAHRREVATTKESLAVGNSGDCAKLREALATIRKRLVAAYESEACFMRYSPNKPLVDLIDAALAVPPRNCDLPEVAKGQPNLAEQAWRVFRRSHKDSYLDTFGLLCCIRWLLSPATEKEGGANG